VTDFLGERAVETWRRNAEYIVSLAHPDGAKVLSVTSWEQLNPNPSTNYLTDILHRALLPLPTSLQGSSVAFRGEKY
jgi:hypothetical protein